MEINLDNLQQKQTLAQSQTQSLNILSFNSIELNQFLHRRICRKPFTKLLRNSSGYYIF